MSGSEILIVEDNMIHAKMIKDMLKAKNFDTAHVENGAEALQWISNHRPDLIIMDIQLPDISGLEVTKAIKADDDLKDIPIIAVTAFASQMNKRKIRDAGCTDILTKPFSMPGLFEIIVRYLGDRA